VRRAPTGAASTAAEQLRAREAIQASRKRVFERYAAGLSDWAAANGVQLPTIPAECEQAYHMFYMLLPSHDARTRLLAHLKEARIQATFHYVPLHSSPMGQTLGGRPGQCPVTEDVSDRLIRLPFWNDLTPTQQDRVISEVRRFPVSV
jgi:dTDP-4-amino-4,6-dideoxygalactose transaminase